MVEFAGMKNVVLALSALAGASCPAAELFNGKDLSGWTAVADQEVTGGYSAAEPTWAVVDGAIRTTGTPFGYLRTKRADFADFKLRLEYHWWRQTARPNSGVFLRLASETGAFIPKCYENQLEPKSVCSVFALGGSELDGVAPRNPYDPANALSGIAAVPARAPSAEKPFGEWNTLEIEAKGDEFVSRLNGKEMNRVKGVKTRKGAVALQAEGGAVEFRNIVIDETPQSGAFVDGVAAALANGGRVDLSALEWTREPAGYTFKDGAVAIKTAPRTDLWQRTYYHFRNDNAPVLQMRTKEKYFSFVVKTDFSQSHQRFDQCGIVMYLDSENWLKGSVEFENDRFQHLGSVATNDGYSDWATTAIPADVKAMWYRFSRRADDYCIECSRDGVEFSQMRVCHMRAGAGEIRFGIYACSPEDSSFTAVFTDMKVVECAWKAHDGQQPD